MYQYCKSNKKKPVLCNPHVLNSHGLHVQTWNNHRWMFHHGFPHKYQSSCTMPLCKLFVRYLQEKAYFLSLGKNIFKRHTIIFPLICKILFSDSVKVSKLNTKLHGIYLRLKSSFYTCLYISSRRKIQRVRNRRNEHLKNAFITSHNFRYSGMHFLWHAERF